MVIFRPNAECISNLKANHDQPEVNIYMWKSVICLHRWVNNTEIIQPLSQGSRMLLPGLIMTDDLM